MSGSDGVRGGWFLEPRGSAQDCVVAFEDTEPVEYRDAPRPDNTPYLLAAMRASRTRELVQFRAACETWLFRERGLKIGDFLLLNARKADERELLLERFELHWSTSASLHDPNLVFIGPTVRDRPRRVTQDVFWGGVSDTSRKLSRPSDVLSDYLKKQIPKKTK